jgi:hypothetical protein
MTSHSKGVPTEDDAREWLLFDIEDEDPVTADFIKSYPTPFSPTASQPANEFPEYTDEDVDTPLIRATLLSEIEAPYVAEAERLERFDDGQVKLPHIGGGILNSIVNMSNSIIGAGMDFKRELR